MKSIRRQMIVTLLICLSVLFAAASSALYLYARSALLAQFDDSLTTKLVSFAGMAEVEEKGGMVAIELDFHDFPLPEYQPGRDCEYYEVWHGEGPVLARSSSLEGGDLSRFEGGGEGPVVEDTVLPDGRQGRAAAFWFHPKGEKEAEPGEGGDERAEQMLYMVIARSRENLDSDLLTLLGGFAVMGLLLGIGMVFTVRWLVGRNLDPLDSIAREISRIESTDLSHRFATERLPRELAPISMRFNELMGRIESAFSRERRFHADIAHELRTPLAELRTLAEVALQSSPESGSAAESPGPDCEPPGATFKTYFRDVLDIARQMEKMVTTLLALVRCEVERQEVKLEPVELAGLIRSLCASHQRDATGREISFTLQLPGSGESLSDRTLLAAIMNNLFSNAVSHTPDGGSILCELSEMENGFLFSLQNTSDRLAPEDLEHLLEPFWQKDSSRTDGKRNGLGLSLVAAYADLLGLKIELSLKEPDLFAVTFRLPAS